MIATTRLIIILALVLLLTLSVMPVQLIFLKTSSWAASKMPITWHRTLLWLFGIKVHIHGKMSDEHPLLLVANHVSWKDILVLGSVKPLSFVAKADMKSWPLLGWLAKLQRTIFVEREQRRKTGAQTSEIAERLIEGEAVVLFAEGTTSDGNKVLPFNSSLLGAAQKAIEISEKDSVMVQPVAIAYTKMHGMALGRYFRPEAAWPGDVGLTSHLTNVVKQGALDVELHFGEPIAFRPDSDRKMITRQIESHVRQMLSGALRGTQ